MKILLIGLIVFISWSALSTYIYVCRIKGLCDNSISIPLNEVKISEPDAVETFKDTLPAKPLLKEIAIAPEKLILYFNFDNSVFQDDRETEKFYSEIRVYFEQNPKAKLNITGHTCSIGTNEYNQDLGYRRAKSVLNYFLVNGITDNKILINSKGESEPVEDNNTASGRANNRRAVIIIK